MKTLLFFYVLLIGLQPPAFAQNETELVKKVKAKLDKVADYQAAGNMAIDVSFIKAPPAAVTVFYKRPNQFKVVKQNGVSILPKGGVSININSLLATDKFTVVPAGTAIVKDITAKVVKLIPLDEASDIVLTTLYIDEKNLLIRKTSVTSKDNGSYEMELDYGTYAAWGLPDHVVFSFNTKNYKLPKGITFDYDKGDKKKDDPTKNKKGKVEITYTSYSINKGIDDKVFRNSK